MNLNCFWQFVCWLRGYHDWRPERRLSAPFPSYFCVICKEIWPRHAKTYIIDENDNKGWIIR